MNVSLIRELNADHAVLMRAVEAIRENAAYNPEVKSLLIKTRAALVRHLEKEEQEFYPVMRTAAEKNEELRNTLKVMGLEMETIAKKALSSIDGWIKNDGGENFMEDFNSLTTILAGRIAREEHSLYSKYLKLAK